MSDTPSHDHDRLLTVTRLGLYTLAFVPILYWSKLLFLHNSTKTYALFAICEIMLVCILWVAARKNSSGTTLSLSGKLLLLYIGILILTSLTGVDPVYSFWGSLDRMGGVLTWLHLGVIFFVARGVFRSPNDWSKFFSFSVCVAVLIALFHLFMIGGATFIPEARGGSTFGNSSFFAIYLLFHIFFALFLAQAHLKKSHRYLWIAAAVILFFTLRTVAAITAHYSVLGGMILLIGLLLIFAKAAWKKIAGWSTIVSLTIIFFVTSILVFQPDSFLHQQFLELSSGSRFALWNMAWEGIRERPILGWGLENFGVASLTYYDPCLGSQACGSEMWFDRAHNKVLDVWIESGLLGLLAYLAIFGATIYDFNQARKKKRITPFVFSLFTTVLAVYFVQNLTVLDINMSLLFWVLILAFINAINAEERRKTYSFSPMLAGVATVLVPLTLYFFVIKPMQGNLAFAQTLNATNLEQRVMAYERGTTRSPLGRDARRIFLADQTANVLWKIPPATLKTIESSARIELSLAQAGLTDSLGHVNQQLRAHIALGIMYQTEGHFFDPIAFEKAERILLQAINLYPVIPQPRWTLAGVYLDEGKLDEALSLTQSVLDSSPLSPQAYNYHLIALKWKGDETAFEQIAAQAIHAIPSLQEDIKALRAVDIQARSQEVLTLFHR